MFIVNLFIARKIIGVEGSVKRRDIVFLESNLAADEGLGASSY